MEALVWIGVAVTLGGLAGIVWCIFQVARIRRSDSGDEDKRRGLQRMVAVNLAALGLSALGLMLVVVGIMIG